MVPAVTRPETAELTPHEVQVALLVAEGRTNREVAAALFLAPKTIEHHLSTIFRKLGIKRRTELARVFAEELTVSSTGTFS
jgi:DNA-binding NarL/FixJ family response regulator